MTEPKKNEVNPLIRGLLICPKCRGELQDMLDGLGCHSCELLFPVRNGVAVMLTARAKKLR